MIVAIIIIKIMIVKLIMVVMVIGDHLHIRAPLRRPKVGWWHQEQGDVVRSDCLGFKTF